MKGRTFVSVAAMGMLVLVIGVSLAFSQGSYPSKPVMTIVAYPAGGETDIGARIVAAIAEKDLGQPMVVVNKGGAGGQLGWTELSRQKPDGYTIGFIGLPSINTVILDPDRKASFGIDAFAPIINQVIDPVCMYVKPDSTYKGFKDLIEDAKNRPQKVTVCTTGILSVEHLAILLLQDAAKVKFRIVHFDGSSQIQAALLGGQIDVGVDNVGGGWTSRVNAGQIRPLVLMDKERSKFYPQTPTTAEMGYPRVIMSSSRGIVGPKGIPEPIIKKLQDVLKKAMGNPEHVAKMDKAGLAIKVMVGEEYGKYIADLHKTTKGLMELARKAD